jgi:hypothetical protein
MRSNNPSSPMGVEIDIVSGNIFSESGKIIHCCPTKSSDSSTTLVSNRLSMDLFLF